MVSEDILMVLFLNCTSTMLNFTAQMHMDYQEVGLAGIMNKTQTESNGILNQTAFDCLTSSIFQLLILFCIYAILLLSKEKNLNNELVDAIEAILAKI